MSKLQELQQEQVDWVIYNFGDRDAWQPLLGIIEELGELEEARFMADLDGIKDAIADTMIYTADLCTAIGLEINNVWKLRRKNIQQHSTMIWAGKLSHSYLKMAQGIRGSEQEHIDDMFVILTYIVGILNVQAVLLGTTAEDLAYDTWQNVKKRDWKKYPETGLPVEQD